MGYVEVIKPGLFTTVQDLGRQAYEMYGVAAAGAMDPLALRLGNLLVGNREGEAALEATLLGPTLRFHDSRLVAVTGGDMEPRLNGSPVPLWRSFRVREGDVLSLGFCRTGCRTYVAVAGGIDVPPVMGSRATFTRAGYGGLEGRALQARDRIPLGHAPGGAARGAGRSLPPRSVPDYGVLRPVRFVPGPQDDAFTPEALALFTREPYTVSIQSDRMGYRLQGPSLSHRRGADIVSDYVPVGSIQVPGDGQPIVLMADSQMSGGYAKIGVVIGADIPYVAQRKPGDRLLFEPVDVEAAMESWRRQEKWIAALRVHNSG